MINFKIFSLADNMNFYKGYASALITPWTLIHFLTGVNTFLILNNYNYNYSQILYIGIIVHTIYEIKDCKLYFTDAKRTDWNDNSIINSIGDTISFVLGLLLGNFMKNNNYINKITLGSSISIQFLFTILLLYLNYKKDNNNHPIVD